MNRIDYGDGISIVYSPVNQAWLGMWHHEVLHTFSTRAAAEHWATQVSTPGVALLAPARQERERWRREAALRETELSVCPNCEQWQRPSSKQDFVDCSNECAKRGFAERRRPRRSAVSERLAPYQERKAHNEDLGRFAGYGSAPKLYQVEWYVKPVEILDPPWGSTFRLTVRALIGRYAFIGETDQLFSFDGTRARLNQIIDRWPTPGRPGDRARAFDDLTSAIRVHAGGDSFTLVALDQILEHEREILNLPVTFYLPGVE